MSGLGWDSVKSLIDRSELVPILNSFIYTTIIPRNPIFVNIKIRISTNMSPNRQNLPSQTSLVGYLGQELQ